MIDLDDPSNRPLPMDVTTEVALQEWLAVREWTSCTAVIIAYWQRWERLHVLAPGAKVAPIFVPVDDLEPLNRRAAAKARRFNIDDYLSGGSRHVQMEEDPRSMQGRDFKAIAHRIREVRFSAGWTGYGMRKRFSLLAGTRYDLENGVACSLGEVEKAALAVNARVEWLLTGEGERWLPGGVLSRHEAEAGTANRLSQKDTTFHVEHGEAV